MFRPLIPYIEYALNYQEISQELCENKDKPEMNCHGKCYLKKQIKNTSKEEQEPAAPTFKKVRLDIYTFSENSIDFNEDASITEDLWSQISNSTLRGYPSGILDPPRV